MTVGQFFDESPALCRAFRKKEKAELEAADLMAWRQGAYFFQALMCAYPAFNPFAGGKIGDYSECMPKSEEQRERESEDDAVAALLNFSLAHNAKMADAAK